MYAGGYLSGGHFNCAVTLACLLYRPRAKEVPKALGYALAQLLGALIAAASVHSALGHAACARAVPVPQGVGTRIHTRGVVGGWFVWSMYMHWCTTGIQGAEFHRLSHTPRHNHTLVPRQSHSWGQALGAEAAFTALLIVTVLLLAAAGAQGHQFFGIAIG